MNHFPIGSAIWLACFLAGDVPQAKQAPVKAPAKADPKPKPAAPAEPFVTLPATIEGKVGAFIPIRPLTNPTVKTIEFVAVDDGLNVFPTGMLSDARSTVVSSASPGRYRLFAYTALGSVPSKPSMTVVIVGGAPPTPTPGPGPVDPVDPVRPAGLAGDLFDVMKPLPKAEVQQMDRVLNSMLAGVAGVPARKATIVRDIVAGMRASTTPPLPQERWTAVVESIKTKMLAAFPDANDDQVVEGVRMWKTATEALSK